MTVTIGYVDRRSFLALTGLAAGSLVLGARPAVSAAAQASDFASLMLSIALDGRIHIAIPTAEMGQGTATSLPLILAEELDADWGKVEVVRFVSTMAVPATLVPANLITANSNSVVTWFEPLRRCGAAARAMLIAAAARRWRIAPATCTTGPSVVRHPNGRDTLCYGELAAAAQVEPVPTEMVFKRPANYRLIGLVGNRTDTREKTVGTAIFASDVRLPGMLYASIRQGPVAGARLTTFDAASAMADPNVRKVAAIAGGGALAAVAVDSWSAMRALDSAKPVFVLKPGATEDGEAFRRSLLSALDRPGVPAPSAQGEVALATPGDKRVEATYAVPFLAHATMEPMSCVARVGEGSCEIWVGTQVPFRARDAVAAALKLPLAQVTVHQTLLGGGFGRRSEVDFILQAVEVAQLAKTPISLIWSRGEDMKHDYYRPPYAMRHRARLDTSGRVAEWHAKTAGPSLLRRRRGGAPDPNGRPDPTVVQSLLPELYRIGAYSGAWVEVETSIPIGFWRSVSHSQNSFAVESFMDELADAAEQDPYAFRRAQMTDARAIAVLDKAAELGDWHKPSPAGRARGIAAVHCYGSYIATVIEASLRDGEIVVHRASHAIDCGLAIHPANIVAQVEGACLFGLTAALYGEITIAGGEVQQESFADYRMLRIGEAPAMRTHVMASDAPPGGVGETGTPTAAPALANALFWLTGKRVRTLPLATAFA